jgi:hypothetical protein
MLKYVDHRVLFAVLLVIAGCGGSETSRSPHSTQRTTDSVAGGTAQEQAVFNAFTKQEPEFRKHYDDHYVQSGYAYNQFRPAYQHGFELGFDPHYRDMDWPGIEREARRRWNESRMGLWDRYHEAVRYGWERGVVAARG